MSHAATNWAIQQRGLKPATKIVLWHLCDRHNPDFGCFPTQVRLAEDAEMSISSLNDHLKKLEELGLIQRIQCQDHRTKRRQATRYILGFEIAGPQEPSPEIGDGQQGTDWENDAEPCPEFGDEANSEFGAVPSPKNNQSHLRNSETNLVREPLSKPVKEEEDAQAREIVDEEFFGSLLVALGFDPDGALPGWWQGWPPREHVTRWQTDLGLTEAEILEAAEASRQEHPEPPDGPKGLDRIMQRAGQRKADEKSRGRRKARKPAKSETRPITDLPVFYAEMVNSDRYLPVSAISNSMRDAMLARGLVTVERLRDRGIR
ncbi:helix-turn-helix domain-containing protein [Thalassobacter sp. 16PALIMAR09]|uniref:helix-turn-helix domain-containing protein n=1 Tax=Thalassobacter sp. 16PALIMAR09 TaxID=1225651 RepID=UPI00051D07C5|nr:helix-turn-helix domain-containing protein [Thalassobacter sp. 16PALIMAR09]KGL00025.1 GntR family transcriptional regulator [Thalassobacter sp. 16PALIMAR09]